VEFGAAAAKPNIQRLQGHAAIKPWMFGFAEVKQSPPSRGSRDFRVMPR
jgi:hypothetical protein